MDKIKIKLLEKRNQHIHYEIWNGKNRINSGWYKTSVNQTKGEIAEGIKKLYSYENN